MNLTYFLIFLITAAICGGIATLAVKLMIRRYAKMEEKERKKEEERRAQEQEE